MSLSFNQSPVSQSRLSLLAQDLLLGVVPAIIEQSAKLQVSRELNTGELEIFFRECMLWALAHNGLPLALNQPLMEQDKFKMAQFCLMVWDRYAQLTENGATSLCKQKNARVAKLYAAHCHFQLALFESVCWFNPSFSLRDFSIIFYSKMYQERFSFPAEIINVYTDLMGCFNPILQMCLSSSSERIINNLQASLCAIERITKVYGDGPLTIQQIHQIIVYGQQVQDDLTHLASSFPKVSEHPDFQLLSKIVNNINESGGEVLNNTVNHLENKICHLKKENQKMLLAQHSKWQTLGKDMLKQYELANQLLEQSYIHGSLKVGYNVLPYSKETGDPIHGQFSLSSPASNNNINNNSNQDYQQTQQNKPK